MRTSARRQQATKRRINWSAGLQSNDARIAKRLFGGWMRQDKELVPLGGWHYLRDFRISFRQPSAHDDQRGDSGPGASAYLG
jgi:hypothetical protein